MNKKNYSYEVMIIGGGPAGNAAARCLAENGIETVVIDGMEKLGDKLCTGIIGLECSELMAVDPALIYREASKVTIHGPDKRIHDLQDDNNHAFIIDRVGYVGGIAEAAQNLGADYLVNHKVTELKIEPSHVFASTISPKGVRLVSAKVVIIASGFGTNLITMAGLEKHGKGEYLVGAQVILNAPDICHTHLFTGKTHVPGSFGWLVPTTGEKAFLGGLYRKSERYTFSRFLDFLIGQHVVSDPSSPVRYWGIPVRPLKKTFARRTLVVGDAAGFAKPTTGGGIYYAILSGLLAAETILTSGKDFESEHMAQYETLWRRRFGQELNVGYYARQLYESLDDKSLGMLLEKFASGEVQSQLLGNNGFSFDWHGPTIRKTIQNHEIIEILNSLGPKSLWILGKMLKSVL